MSADMNEDRYVSKAVYNGTVKTGTIYICSDCGVQVFYAETHDSFHDALDTLTDMVMQMRGELPGILSEARRAQDMAASSSGRER